MDKVKFDKHGDCTNLYIKEGRKYRLVKFWEFPRSPAEGIWVVTDDEYSTGYRKILFKEEFKKHDVPKLARLHKYKHHILCDMMENYVFNISRCELVDKILKEVCRK